MLQSAPYRHIAGAGKSAWTKRMETLFVNGRRNVYIGISQRRRSAVRVRAACGARKLYNLNIVRGERRECYPMQCNRIVGIMSDYRVWS